MIDRLHHSVPAGSSANQQRDSDQAAADRSHEIDVEQLADRVYRLMLADVRLARARGAVDAGRREG